MFSLKNSSSKAGQTDIAQKLLRQVVALGPNNERTWLWLSGVVDDPAERPQSWPNACQWLLPEDDG